MYSLGFQIGPQVLEDNLPHGTCSTAHDRELKLTENMLQRGAIVE